jgi:methoxymalonate biosynthesis acyl carrier protein
MTDIHTSVKKFLTRYFHDRALKYDEDLFADGIINSLFALQLVLFVESEFSITVTNEDLDIEHFRTVNNIVAFVTQKQQKTA